MDDRTVIQWDKDDLDALGLLKVDVLALGMLTAMRKRARPRRASIAAAHCTMRDDPGRGRRHLRHDPARPTRRRVPDREPRADGDAAAPASRASFYDLVIEVAIVRPGPIQGGMVHPYLRRRQGEEPVDYPTEALQAACSSARSACRSSRSR